MSKEDWANPKLRMHNESRNIQNTGFSAWRKYMVVVAVVVVIVAVVLVEVLVEGRGNISRLVEAVVMVVVV